MLAPRHPTRPSLRPLLLLLALAVSACGAPPSEVDLVDLVGRVESASGAPMPGVRVHAGGTLTTAASDGSFEIARVKVPYTLTVASTGADPWVHAFAGLTSASPLVVPAMFDAPMQSATLSGHAWGGDPVPVGRRVSVCVQGLEVVVWGCGFADEGDVTYSMPVHWWGAATTSLRVRALYQVVDAADLPTGYTGVGIGLTAVTHDATAELDFSQTIMMGAAATVPVTVDGGVGTVSFVSIGVRNDGGVVHTIYRGPWPGGATQVALPHVALGDRYQVAALVEFAGAGDRTSIVWGMADRGAALHLVAPPPPQLVEPSAGAADVTSDTLFRASGGDVAARQYAWSPRDGAIGPRIRLTTLEGTARLPDLAAVGLAYPAGSAYVWRATDIVAPDGDAAVAMRFGFFDLYGFGGAGPAVDGAIAESDIREFAFAP